MTPILTPIRTPILTPILIQSDEEIMSTNGLSLRSRNIFYKMQTIDRQGLQTFPTPDPLRRASSAGSQQKGPVSGNENKVLRFKKQLAAFVTILSNTPYGILGDFNATLATSSPFRSFESRDLITLHVSLNPSVRG